MLCCCVPKCGTDSVRCDSSVSFHNFPSNPDAAAKWIKQINFALKTKPMWVPRGRVVICSKHFLQTDFKGNTDVLKPKCVPTVFGHKYIGQNAHEREPKQLNQYKTTPLIVKVIKPQENVLENSSLGVPRVNSEVKVLTINPRGRENGGTPKCYSKFQQSSHQNSASNNDTDTPFTALEGSLVNKFDAKVSVVKNGPKRSISNESNTLAKPRKKEKSNDLIEIGPNTFLKINPEVIKVNKKLTPSGNTVLQFLMDQKLANSHAGDLLPRLIQGASTSLQTGNFDSSTDIQITSSSKVNNLSKDSNSCKKSNATVVQHVLGHLVDTHICEESCADLKLPEDETVPMDESLSEENVGDSRIVHGNSQSREKNGSTSEPGKRNSSGSTDTAFFEKAPVLLTTNMPISHCFMEKPKYILQLKQKHRQISALKFKMSNLAKKIEELEDRCIVQERQLSYSFIKRLKTIRKNSAKGDPAATYILEQIRSYPTNNSKMRWSDSTLTQCAIWCRKAPYAYEYFKKAEFFKLPCLGTVKRFMRKHPELKTQKKKQSSLHDEDDESSSDFDFDESDHQNSANESSEENSELVACETVLTIPSDMTNPETTQATDNLKRINEKESENCPTAENDTSQSSECQNQLNEQNNTECDNAAENAESAKSVESSVIPITVDSSNLELQEIILPSGEVVQCYSSSISNGADGGSQYFIIPNVGDQNSIGDHEYSVVQADSLPAILQNLENSQLHLQQSDQLIFITNSADQVECTETEVTSM